jgi:hypothetical protein
MPMRNYSPDGEDEVAAISRRFNTSAIKKGAYKRRREERMRAMRRKPRPLWLRKLGYLVLRLPVLPLDGLHLVLQAKFQLLQPDFFQLFIFGEIAFLGE